MKRRWHESSKGRLENMSEGDRAARRRAMPAATSFLQLRVASYNIRKAIGRDARRDPARVLALVASLHADIVALQEGDYRFKGRQAIFDRDMIEAFTRLRPVPMPHDGPGLGWHGNLLLVAQDIEVRAVRCLDLRGLEPRGALLADLSLADVPMRVIGTHLSLLARYRRRQAETLLAAADLSSDRATLVMGDFNGWGPLPRSLAAFDERMTLADTGNSYPSRRPITPLDRIFFTGGMRLTGCGVSHRRPASIASDHLPIWADFQLVIPAERGSDRDLHRRVAVGELPADANAPVEPTSTAGAAL